MGLHARVMRLVEMPKEKVNWNFYISTQFTWKSVATFSLS
jgi:hypothetical protein